MNQWYYYTAESETILCSFLNKLNKYGVKEDYIKISDKTVYYYHIHDVWYSD